MLYKLVQRLLLKGCVPESINYDWMEFVHPTSTALSTTQSTRKTPHHATTLGVNLVGDNSLSPLFDALSLALVITIGCCRCSRSFGLALLILLFFHLLYIIRKYVTKSRPGLFRNGDGSAKVIFHL